MGAGGFGGGIGHVGVGHHTISAAVKRTRSGSRALDSAEAMLAGSNEAIPQRPLLLVRFWREFCKVRKERWEARYKAIDGGIT